VSNNWNGGRTIVHRPCKLTTALKFTLGAPNGRSIPESGHFFHVIIDNAIVHASAWDTIQGPALGIELRTNPNRDRRLVTDKPMCFAAASDEAEA
jgi:hypothetical protein